jgi:5-methylcytosine-specific restriction protein B
MNLSHVERYFADILSAIESSEDIPLYEGAQRQCDGRDIPRALPLPDNLFIIGTVNVDETTYMFSPKVLDRANVIEFRVTAEELAAFLEKPEAPDLNKLDAKGLTFAAEFVNAASQLVAAIPDNLFRGQNTEFGYRVAREAARFLHFYQKFGGFAAVDKSWFKDAFDSIIVQKFLPKLHGSRSKLEGLLWALAWACGPVTIQVFPEDKWWRRSYTKRISRRTQPPGSFLKKPLDSKIGTL